MIEAIKTPTETAKDTGAKPDMASHKLSAPQRRAQLDTEIGQMVKQRNQLRNECQQLRGECQGLGDAKELERTNRELKNENEALLLRLVNFEALGDVTRLTQLKDAEAARIQAENAIWNSFLQKCNDLRQQYPDLDECVRAIGAIPTSWIRAIATLPNGPEFIVFLGRSKDFRDYLCEFKEEAAVKRIERAAYDLRQQHASKAGG